LFRPAAIFLTLALVGCSSPEPSANVTKAAEAAVDDDGSSDDALAEAQKAQAQIKEQGAEIEALTARVDAL
jgi:PBP1b-binding outer membrane lipoprotein LpoB